VSFEAEKKSTPKAIIRPKLVVGGDIGEDYLEVPTYMRRQQD